jgi:hypothetical protein
MFRSTSLICLVLLICFDARPQAASPSRQKTVLDGVFTAAQAARGDALYAANCARCHEGADVDGPPLTGDPFLDRWREDKISTLFTFIRTKMPQDSPGKLNESQYVDILAHLLDANMLPPGSTELTAAAIPETWLVGRNGPRPLPSNAMVRVTGCLGPGENKSWTLLNAGDLARARDGQQTAEDLKQATSRPPGSATYRLQNIDELQPSFDAEANKGHKVLATGVLVHQTAMDRINVMAMASLGATCTP